MADRTKSVLTRYHRISFVQSDAVLALESRPRLVQFGLLWPFFPHPSGIVPVPCAYLLSIGGFPAADLFSLPDGIFQHPLPLVFSVAIPAYRFHSELQLLFCRSELREWFFYLAGRTEFDLIVHSLIL